MYDDREWLTFPECAQRMNLSVAEVEDLARQGELRVRRDGWMVLVEPAVVNATPRVKAPVKAAKRAPRRTARR